MNIIDELKERGFNPKTIKKIIKEDKSLTERLYKETWYLQETIYDNFDDRYKFLRIGGNEKNYKCPYCNKIKKMAQSRLCDTCGDISCIKQNQHRVKTEMNKNMNEQTKRNKREKMKKTCLEKYGVEYSTQTKQMKEKSSKTKLERYGNEKYVNIEKRIKTNKEKYGGNAPLCDENVRNKMLETNIRKYGVYNVFQNEDVKSQIIETNIRKYGVQYPMMSKDIQNKVDYAKAVEKQFLSKQRNGTLHTSSHEEKIFEYLIEKYRNVKKQYTDNRYANPKSKLKFKCDFYLVDYDLFIEYQGTYHHGGEPFDNNNELHIKKLSEWKERSENHINSDYKEAIRIWTIKDPLKRSVAKNNKLNYLEIWPEEYGKCPTKEKIIEIVERKINNI